MGLPARYGTSVTFVSNNTAVYEVFDRCIRSWDQMSARRLSVQQCVSLR